MYLETINKLYLELSQIATARTRRDIENDEQIAWYVETLEDALGLLCEAVGVSTERYDSDQSDTECYMDCFKQMAELLKKSDWEFDDEENEFLQKKPRMVVRWFGEYWSICDAKSYQNVFAPEANKFRTRGDAVKFAHTHGWDAEKHSEDRLQNY